MICFHCMSYVQQNKGNCPYCGRSMAPREIPLRYLRPGTMLNGHYLLGYPMKSGGFGNTYIARNQMLRQVVAIKEFYPSQYVDRSLDGKNVVLSDPSMKERYQTGLEQFIIEGKKVAALKGIRGVVDISAYFEENNTGYIVMEFIEGVDVDTILKQSGRRIDYNSALQIILPVLYTLKQLHGNGIIHRDISPDNIMINRENVVKLIDFGAAKHCAMPDASQEIFLKKGYAPIEQYGHSIPQGGYTDLYAVAATFYRMLTGQTPVPANKRKEQDLIPTPTMLGAQLPRYAEDAIMVCLNYNPKYRLQNAEQFMEALHCKDFVPAYEQSANIKDLQPVASDEELKKNEKNTKGKIPLPVFVVALAVIAFGLGIGSFFLFLNKNADEKVDEVPPDETVLVPNLRGDTIEEAEQKLNAWISGSKRIKGTADDFSCTYAYIYDADRNDEEIIRQIPEAGEEVVEYKAGEAEAKSDEPSNQLYLEDSKLHGKLEVTVQTNNRISYEEILGWNAYSMHAKLGEGESIRNDKRFEAVSDEALIAGKDYYQILSIETGNGTLDWGSLEAGAAKGAYLDPDTIIKIRYAAGNFFYWDAFPNYAGMNLYGENAATGTLYRKSGEGDKDREVVTPFSHLSGNAFVDDSYYSFTLAPGTIIRQYPQQGATVDATKLDSYKNGILIDAIAKNGRIETKGTGAGLRMRLLSLGFMNVDIVGGDESGKVLKCVAEKDGKKIKNEFFSLKNADKIRFVITTEKPVVQVSEEYPYLYDGEF